MWRCPDLEHCHNQTAQCVKTGKYSFKRGIISPYILVKTTQVSLYPFWSKNGKLVQVSFNSVAVAALPSFARWCCCGEWHNSSHLVLSYFFCIFVSDWSADAIKLYCQILLLVLYLMPSVLWRCWLGGRKGIRPVKNLSGGVLAFVWSEVQTCIWPSWCHCHSLSLASVKSRLVLPFWYPLTRVVPEKGPLNGCVCH